jgi:hypothetical protein
MIIDVLAKSLMISAFVFVKAINLVIGRLMGVTVFACGW